MLVTDEMRLEVRTAVEELEKATAGEMVCVISQSSARYILFPLLWAAIFALALPALNLAIPFVKPGFGGITFPLQSGLFALMAGLFLLKPLRCRLTPTSVLYNNCRNRAFEQFFVQKLHETTKRTGILIYVSVDEHYVEILADKGVNEYVPVAEWGIIVKKLEIDVRKSRIHDGFVQAVSACKAVLAERLPEMERIANELADGLVELEDATLLS